jgi:hypothetical protein
LDVIGSAGDSTEPAEYRILGASCLAGKITI